MPRYRCNANLNWDMEGDSQQAAQEEASELLIRMLEAGGIKKRPKVTVNRLRDQKVTQRLAEFPALDIFNLIGDSPKNFQFGDKIYSVRMNSHRYHTFKENLKCVVCGVEGSKMVLELPHKARQPHFNLYAVEEGEYILMTKDHIKPKSQGGADFLENYQTMCHICNGFRGADEFTIGEVRYLRAIYNNHRGKISDDGVRKAIRKEKAKLHADRKSTCDSVLPQKSKNSSHLGLSA